MLNAGAALPSRRQAMLYVTNGYHLDPADVRVAGFASAARRANVTVFAMNARGLPSAPAWPVQGDAALWASYRAALLKSLRAISEPTGGFAVLDEADFADALPRIGRSVR
jgi:DNA-binding LacI/PurR family transcriptional regulator